MQTRQVILIHGLWLRGFTLGPLGRRLRAAGLEPHTVDYASVRHGPERAAERVARRLADAGAPVHLVGHSLGGLVALKALSLSGPGQVGRVVCLGTPLAGSAAARGLLRWRLGGALLGRARPFLEHGVGSVAGHVAVGMVAGTRALGLGRFFGAGPGPSDGTVAVAETRVPGLAGHVEVHTSHTGLLFSADAARHVAAFLQTGRFAAG